MKDRFNIALRSFADTAALHFHFQISKLNNFQIIFFIILFLSACRHDNKKTVIIGMDEAKESIIDDVSPKLKNDSAVINGPSKATNILADDSVFADGSRPTTWDVAGIKDVKALKLFIQNIQYLVASDRKLEIGTHIRYPLKKSVKNVTDFYKNYDKLFTAPVKRSLAKTNLRQLFRNSHGVMIGDGKVWITQQGNEFKIIAINN